MNNSFGRRNKEVDAFELSILLHAIPSEGGVVQDHGALLGLSDDDHSQYVHLSASRTITAQHWFSPAAPQAPFALGANAQGQTVVGLKADQLSKSISVSGLGLSGGGILDANRTITLASSSNPGIAASVLATDASGFLSLVRLNTDTIGDKSGGNLTIAPTGDVTFNPTGKDILPLTNYDLNIGAINKKYLTLHAAELCVETLVTQSTMATIGGRITVAPPTTLTIDVGVGYSMIEVKHNNLVIGDIIYLESNGKVEWIGITSNAIPSGSNFLNNVTRNLDGSGANDWYAGDTVLNTGQVGDGYIDIYSMRSIRSASQVGPTIVGNVRTGTTYNNILETWAIGNLNGLYGYGADTYGVGFGRYANNSSYITIEPGTGINFNFLDGAGNYHLMARWWMDGGISIGEYGVGKSWLNCGSGLIEILNNYVSRFKVSAAGLMTINDSGGAAVFTFDASAGAEFTKPLTLGTNGGIYQGSGSFASPTTGLKIYNASGVGKISGYNAGVEQWCADTDGKLKAGGGVVVLDSNGIKINATTTGVYGVIKWYDGSNNNRAQISSYLGSGDAHLKLICEGDGSAAGVIRQQVGLSGIGIGTTITLDLTTSGLYLSGVDGVPILSVTGSIYTSGDVRFNNDIGAIYFGATNDVKLYRGWTNCLAIDDLFFSYSDIAVVGNFQTYKNSTFYAGYLFMPLTTPLASTSWDGDLRSTIGKTLIDLSAVFGIPAGVKAILVTVALNDTASSGGDYWFMLSPNNTSGQGINTRLSKCPNSAYHNETHVVPCNANGDVYYQINASGTNTMQVYLEIWGYWI